MPFQDWIDSLTGSETRSRLWARINRVRLGSLGDWKSVGEGVHEMRIDVVRGIGSIWVRNGKSLVILLCGETKAKVRTLQTQRDTGRVTGPERCREAYHTMTI
jgi:putative addiction module killer protein